MSQWHGNNVEFGDYISLDGISRILAQHDKENEVPGLEVAGSVVASFLPLVEYNRRTDSLHHPGGTKAGLRGRTFSQRSGFGIIRDFRP